MKPLTVYTAASFRLLHAVRLFHDALRARIPDVQILDWTDKATPPAGLTPDQRRQWFAPAVATQEATDGDSNWPYGKEVSSTTVAIRKARRLANDWRDTEQQGGQVYEFCADACRHADVVVYLGASGQDAGVEVGLAAGAGTPVLGVRGPLEAPGLMLHGAVSLWCYAIQEAVDVLTLLGRCCGGWSRGPECSACKGRPVCNVLVGATWRGYDS